MNCMIVCVGDVEKVFCEWEVGWFVKCFVYVRCIWFVSFCDCFGIFGFCVDLFDFVIVGVCDVECFFFVNYF